MTNAGQKNFCSWRGELVIARYAGSERSPFLGGIEIKPTSQERARTSASQNSITKLRMRSKLVRSSASAFHAEARNTVFILYYIDPSPLFHATLYGGEPQFTGLILIDQERPTHGGREALHDGPTSRVPHGARGQRCVASVVAPVDFSCERSATQKPRARRLPHNRRRRDFCVRAASSR